MGRWVGVAYHPCFNFSLVVLYTSPLPPSQVSHTVAEVLITNYVAPAEMWRPVGPWSWLQTFAGVASLRDLTLLTDSISDAVLTDVVTDDSLSVSLQGVVAAMKHPSVRAAFIARVLRVDCAPLPLKKLLSGLEDITVPATRHAMQRATNAASEEEVRVIVTCSAVPESASGVRE